MGPSYNDSFGSSQMPGGGAIVGGGAGGGGGTPIASGEGDVVLTLTGGRSKKRGPMMIVILLFVVAIVTGVAAIVLGGGNGKKSGDNVNRVPTGDAQAEFNQVLNYFVSNKESDKNMTWEEYEAAEPYAVLNFGKNAGYFEKLQTKVDEFGKKYVGEDGDDVRVGWLRNYCELAIVGAVSEDDVVNAYLESGENGARQKANGFRTVESTSEEVMEYAMLRRNMADKMIAAMGILDAAGCINDGEVDEYCGGVTREYQTLMDEYMTDYGAAYVIVTRVTSNALNALSGLYVEIYGTEGAA